MGKMPFPALEVSAPPDPVKTDYPVSRPGEHDVMPVKLKEMGPTLAGERYTTAECPLTSLLPSSL